jgi:UDP-2-acetamido-2-deoxy-ribo-hexuluronate aminotransferase
MLGKWPGFADEVVARGRLGARYTEKLQDVCKTPEVREGNTHVYAQYTLLAPDRDALGEKLKTKGVPTAVYYPKCLHEQPVFAHLGYKYGDFPNAEAASREVISLPLNPYLTEAEQDFVINGVRESLNR